MQYTILARSHTTGTVRVSQYGTDKGVKAALAYAQRIWQGFDEHEAIECRCENNGDYCEACQVFHIYNPSVLAK